MSEVATDGEDSDRQKQERRFVIHVLQEIMDRKKCTEESVDGQLAYVDGLASGALLKLVILNDPKSPFYGMVKEVGE